MPRHQILALLLAIAAVTGCRTEHAPRATAPAAQDDNGIQGTVVGDDRTAMEAAVDSGSGASTSPLPAEAARSRAPYWPRTRPTAMW